MRSKQRLKAKAFYSNFLITTKQRRGGTIHRGKDFQTCNKCLKASWESLSPFWMFVYVLSLNRGDILALRWRSSLPSHLPAWGLSHLKSWDTAICMNYPATFRLFWSQVEAMRGQEPNRTLSYSNWKIIKYSSIQSWCLYAQVAVSCYKMDSAENNLNS